jgi:hypothetical protein
MSIKDTQNIFENKSLDADAYGKSFPSRTEGIPKLGSFIDIFSSAVKYDDITETTDELKSIRNDLESGAAVINETKSTVAGSGDWTGVGDVANARIKAAYRRYSQGVKFGGMVYQNKYADDVASRYIVFEKPPNAPPSVGPSK